MITQEQFTDAMERAVEKRGESWRYPRPDDAPRGFYNGNMPTYQDKNGTPTCLIGMAMRLLGMYVPPFYESPSCLSILVGPMDSETTFAARAAQIHQDAGHPWGEALRVYRAALEVQQDRDFSIFESNNLYARARAKVEGREFVETGPRIIGQVTTTLNDLKVAFDGITTATGTFTFSTGDMTASSGSTITLQNFAGSPVVSYFGEAKAVLSKKEHALIA